MSCYSIFGKGIAGDYSQWKARPWSVEAQLTQGVENGVSGAPISQSPPNQNPLLVSEKQREKGTLLWPHVDAWGPEASGHRRAWWASETNSLAAQGLRAAASSLFGSTPGPEIWTERQALLPSGDGWWRWEQAVFCPWVKTPLPTAQSGSHSCPVTPGFTHHAPSPTGSELGKVGPQSWELSTVVIPAPISLTTSNL